MKIGSITRFLFIGGVVGIVAPFAVSLCLFGTTLQEFVVAPPQPGGFWSGGPTPVPTPVPSQVQVVTGKALSAGGGAVFILWTVLGAFAGQALAVRAGKEWHSTRNAWLGAIAGAVIFIGLGIFGLPR